MSPIFWRKESKYQRIWSLKKGKTTGKRNYRDGIKLLHVRYKKKSMNQTLFSNTFSKFEILSQYMIS